MSPVNFCVTVARVTLGPGGAPAGFSFQSLISKPPLASFFNVVTSSGFRIDGWNNSPGLIRTLRKCGRGWKPDAEESEVLGYSRSKPGKMERETGIEPATSTLGRSRSAR